MTCAGVAVTSGAVLQRKIGDVSAVADVSFTIRPGQTFGMVGESGSGKTTIGRLIAGLEKASGKHCETDMPAPGAPARAGESFVASCLELMFGAFPRCAG
jgi:ABC-type glutathione transport system ATPase component